jgi:hypothetical protein
MDMLNPKKKQGLNIISSATNHGGFGGDAFDLNAIAPVMIEEGRAYIDMGALHARSALEKGIKFTTHREDVPNGKRCWIVWIASARNEKGAFYSGATACEMSIDRENRRGFKILADHVNRMDYAMKRRFMLQELNDEEKAALKKLLMENNPKMWENSPEALYEQLG